MSLAMDANSAHGRQIVGSTCSPSVETLEFAVEGITCPACMVKIEKELTAITAIRRAQLNLTSHRLKVEAAIGDITDEEVIAAMNSLGYRARPFALDHLAIEDQIRATTLLHAMAVAGFAAANVMLLSVSVWSGNATSIEPETRDLFHWLSGLIAIPAAAYAGQTFYISAFSALKKRRLNMDVPISLAVILALVMSVIQTASGARDAYFDSAIMLLFFLLIGRYLEFLSRRKTRNLGQNLLALQKPNVDLVRSDGTICVTAASAIRPGHQVLVPAGVRIGIDGVVIAGNSAIDASLITGETSPQSVVVGSSVYAGTVNLQGALTIKATARSNDSLLSQMSSLMDKAMERRGTYVALADRAAEFYAPIVHIVALATFLGWIVLGASWQPAMLNAIAVLIITCPCALGLAVPVVQVVATGLLFRVGILVNQGDALERLALIDHVVFDKTGTLTEPDPRIVNGNEIDPDSMNLATRLALSSHHVLSKALSFGSYGLTSIPGAIEIAGCGVKARLGVTDLRLGSAEFCSIAQSDLSKSPALKESHSSLWFCEGNRAPVCFHFAQSIKTDAKETIAALGKLGTAISIYSGDRQSPVKTTAQILGIPDFKYEMTPDEKIHAIEDLRQSGKNILMVGDGLNDAAALQAADISAAPASALDITKAASDIVIVGNNLMPLVYAIRTARRARSMMLQNFAFATAYNAIAIPLAVVGLVTPLLAALFMSGSSILVTLNALRLKMIKEYPR